MIGAPVLAASAGRGERRLQNGVTVRAGDVSLTIVATPGHTPDHVAFHESREGALFTGDTVLGRGTSVIDPPEGDLTAYLRSLERMRSLRPEVIYPGHGPIVRPAIPKLVEYLEHRARREQQVLAALDRGPRTAAEMVPEIYVGYPEELREPAARSVLAHLLKLEQEGRVSRTTQGADRFELVQPPGIT
jgi:glyoxylase-like metal-dependent hydrolase (beta-lactamase superfamily II)